MTTSDQDSCRNCGTPLGDRYCPHCGQPARIAIPSARQFLRDFADKSLALQARLPLTLRALLSPGQLTVDYLDGRRERYLKPLNLYVAVSVLFFLLLSAVPGIDVRIGWTLEIETKAEARSTIAADSGIAALDGRVAAFARLPPQRQQRVLRDGMIRNAPRVLFVLVPLFALLLHLLVRGRYYGEHLLFALHFHGFAFLALLPGLVPWPQPAHDVINDLINVVIVGYLFFALRRVYGGGLVPTAARTAIIVAVYVAALTGATLLGVIAALRSA
ncbi:DUF3667 domain-containing protein [Solimonas soli]|uniref:DUF3667 domain-containing protein n=1 Tax=Solimonas soli TaxID=413479 RepID=UPI000488331D|nr:DUF3667 domain-containing protein [Solimonas soli]